MVDATLAETHEDDPTELNLRAPVPVAGEDDIDLLTDEELARIEQAVDAAANESDDAD